MVANCVSFTCLHLFSMAPTHIEVRTASGKMIFLLERGAVRVCWCQGNPKRLLKRAQTKVAETRTTVRGWASPVLHVSVP